LAQHANIRLFLLTNAQEKGRPLAKKTRKSPTDQEKIKSVTGFYRSKNQQETEIRLILTKPGPGQNDQSSAGD